MFWNLKSVGKALAATVVGSVMTSTVAAAQQSVSVATSSSGSDPYVNGAIIASTVNSAQGDYNLSIQSTGGYRDNLGLVVGGNVDVGMNSLIELVAAYNGTGDFAEMPEGAFSDLRMLFVFGVVPQNFVVRADSGIEDLAGIAGKRINLNTPASFTYGLNVDLLEVAGISLSNFEPGTVSTGQVFDEMQNRIFDGGLHVFQLGLGSAQQMATTTDVRWLPIDAETLNGLNERYDNLLVPFTIPAGTYTGQEEDVATFGVPQVLFVRADADEEMVYQVTKGFWENIEEASSESSGFTGMTPEIGSVTSDVPFHPGAERYFTEIGLR